MLADAPLEQFQQRVLASCHLGPLSVSETKEYVEHRLRTAGWVGDPSFDEPAFVALYNYSSGIPRRINILCSRTLLAGYLDETHAITEAMVNDVAGELQRDLAAGRRNPLKEASAGEDRESDLDHLDQRLISIERAVARHDRAIKRTLEITARLIEASS